MNQNYTLPAFAEPITSLTDTPTCVASELKRRFQSPADEVREAHNALAEAHEKLDEKVEGIVTETFTGAIHESMFDAALSEKLNGKADQTALHAEIAAREETDAQVAKKCEVVFGTYTGDGQESQYISLGFAPTAVFSLETNGNVCLNYNGVKSAGGLALPDCPVQSISSQNSFDVVKIEGNGFRVYYTQDRALSNQQDKTYVYLAIR